MADRIFRVKQGRSIEGVRYDPSSPDAGKRYYRPSSDVRETVISSMVRNGMVEEYHGPDPFASGKPAAADKPATQPAPPPSRMPQSRTAPSTKGKSKGKVAEPVKTQSRAGKVAQALDEEKTALLNAQPAPYNPVTDENVPPVDDESDQGEDTPPISDVLSVEAAPDQTVPSGTLSPVREPGE